MKKSRINLEYEITITPHNVDKQTLLKKVNMDNAYSQLKSHSCYFLRL